MTQQTIESLIKDLRNARRLLGPDWNKRIAAAQQLDALHAAEAVDDLAAVIGEKKNADLCLACVQALGHIGGPQAVQMLGQVLADPDQATLHTQTIAALQQIGDEAAVTALIAGWTQPDPAREQAISEALTRLGPDHVFNPLLAAYAGSTPLVSEQAGKMLRQLPDSATRLVAALGNPEPFLRSGAAHLLAQMGAASIPALVMTLGQADQNARSAAVSALSQIGAPAVLELIKALTGPAATVSETAGQALVSMGQPATRPLLELLPAWPPVADLLTQMKPDVKAVLDKTSTGDLPLIKAAFELSDTDLRASAGQALARIGKPAVAYLAEALNGDDNGKAQAAATALGQMGEPAVVELIKGLLSDNEKTSRLAADGLVKTGEPAIRSLLHLLGQPDEQGRNRAVRLLLRIDAPEAVMLRPFLTSWQERETCPHTLVIDPAGKGDFVSLVDAIATAAPMSIIHFPAGDHRLESQLFITKPLALLGSGIKQTRLLCNGPLILHDGPILIHGLNIEYKGREENDVVTVFAKEAHLDKCRFAGGSVPRMGASIGGRGLALIDVTQCKVTRCEFEQNAIGSIIVGGYAKPVLEDNDCQGNGYAIDYCGSAAGTARRNRCTTREGCGILLMESAHPILEANICERNAFGIQYRNSSSGTAYQNQCKNNSIGIAVQDESKPTLEANMCSENSDHGISICDQSRPTMLNNTCQNNGSGGIFFFDSASGTARANYCLSNDTGIVVDDNAKPELTGNLCQRNRRSGIVYIGSSSGVARFNQCNDNREIGMLILDQAHPNLQQNICQGNVFGCRIQASSRARVEGDNNFRGNRQADFVDERQ